MFSGSRSQPKIGTVWMRTQLPCPLPSPRELFGHLAPPTPSHPCGPWSLTFSVQESKNENTDPLHGLRVHSWVLVLSGKREVPESFFIDPFTARSYSPQDDHFLGIESLWNHKNYWVNMQDCWNCCKVPGRGLCGRGGHRRGTASGLWGEVATRP